MTQTVKNLTAMQETQVPPLGQEDPLEKGMASPVFLPRELHGERSLEGYSQWCYKKATFYGVMTEQPTPSYWFVSSLQSLSHVRLFATPWTAACLASLSITNS